jgi:hypothetical protein
MLFNPQLLFDIDPQWISLAIIENGVPRYDTTPLNWLNSEGNHLSKEEIISLGYYGVISQQITFDPEKEKVIENELNIADIDEENHTITKTYTITPFDFQELSFFVRQKRNDLLEKTDVLTLSDRWESYDDMTRESIRNYRENLRNIPDQENFPYDVTWPILVIGNTTEPGAPVPLP